MGWLEDLTTPTVFWNSDRPRKSSPSSGVSGRPSTNHAGAAKRLPFRDTNSTIGEGGEVGLRVSTHDRASRVSSASNHHKQGAVLKARRKANPRASPPTPPFRTFAGPVGAHPVEL